LHAFDPISRRNSDEFRYMFLSSIFLSKSRHARAH
jgi:hypothetical protein